MSSISCFFNFLYSFFLYCLWCTSTVLKYCLECNSDMNLSLTNKKLFIISFIPYFYRILPTIGTPLEGESSPNNNNPLAIAV